MAPAKAATGRAKNVVPPQPRRTAATAPSAAPAPTPRRPESASGLRNTDCSVAPTTASPPPTTAARRTRGRRTTHRIVSDGGGKGAPAPRPVPGSNDASTPEKGGGTLPA